MKITRKIRFVYFLTLVGILIWTGVIFLAPYLKSESASFNVICYAFFSPICHQMPSRSFFLLGHPLAVCARCLGIYFGFLAGTALYPLLKGFSSLSLPKHSTFLLLSFPIVFDTIGNFFHFWATSNEVRFIIGFLWGIILPFYFIFGITDLYSRFAQKKENQKGTRL